MNDAASSTPAHQLLEQLQPTVTAWSVDGRALSFTCGFDLDAPIGSIVVVTTADGDHLLAQVHQRRVTTRDTVRVELDTDELGDAPVRSATLGMGLRVVEAEGQILGRFEAGVLHPGTTAPFTDGHVERAGDDAVGAVTAATLGSSAGLEIGGIDGTSIPARLKASGFARHTFMCGQSGSGKTYSLGVVLERLMLETDLRAFVVDPNSDYVNLGTLRSRDEINRDRARPLTKSEYADLARRYRDQGRVGVARAGDPDLPLRIHLSNLTIEEQGLTIELDPVSNAEEFGAFVEATSSFGGQRYGFAEISTVLARRYDEASRRLAQRIHNFGVANWSVWARPDEPTLVERAPDFRMMVADTGSLPDARERSVAALALLGGLRRRAQRVPLAVVIDEAHNVCSPDASTALERAVAAHTVWVAGEGRKYGIYLVLSTQRPQKIERNVISQCDNLLLMRVNSVADVAELADVFSHVPRAMVEAARTFQLGEMLAAGPIANTPIRLRVGERWTPQGGADLPTTWAAPKS